MTIKITYKNWTCSLASSALTALSMLLPNHCHHLGITREHNRKFSKSNVIPKSSESIEIVLTLGNVFYGSTADNADCQVIYK